MFRIPSTVKTTIKDVLEPVSAAAGVIASGAEALANLAETGDQHAQAYLEETKITLEATAERRRHAAILKTTLDYARQKFDLEKKLDADPNLREIYEALQEKDFSFNKFQQRKRQNAKQG